MKRPTGYLYRRGERWYCRVIRDGKPVAQVLRDELGKPITVKRDAEKARADFLAAVTGTERRGGPKSWEIYGMWKAFEGSAYRPECGTGTLENYVGQWLWFEAWAKRKGLVTADQVNEDAAADFCKTLDGRSSGTYNKYLNLLALVWKTLRIEPNVWRVLPRKRGSAVSRRELTVEELRCVCGKAEGELRVLLAIGIYTGMRLGDCCTLRWDEVDMVRSLIRRVPSKTADRGGRMVQLPIHTSLFAMLSECKQRRSVLEWDYVLPGCAKMYVQDRRLMVARVQYLFSSCGIETTKALPGRRQAVVVGFHSLRHTFVSMCREANVPLAVVEAMVGHSNPAMTRHYTHVGESAAEKAVGMLPDIS